MFKLRNNVIYTVKYLPTARCFNERQLRMVKTTDFYINEVSSSDAPVAFEVTQYENIYPNANEKGYAKRPIRLYQGSLYKEFVENLGHANSHFLDLDNESLKRHFQLYPAHDTQGEAKDDSWYEVDRPLTDDSVITFDGYDETKKKMQASYSKKWLIINGRLYEKTDEPRYNYVGFGLGRNHGGTGFFVEYSYNGNLSKDTYFRADQTDDAYNAAIKFALKRGDTDSAKYIRDKWKNKETYIKILIPEAVKLDPQNETGDGDPFLNLIEDIIQDS